MRVGEGIGRTLSFRRFFVYVEEVRKSVFEQLSMTKKDHSLSLWLLVLRLSPGPVAKHASLSPCAILQEQYMYMYFKMKKR